MVNKNLAGSFFENLKEEGKREETTTTRKNEKRIMDEAKRT